MVNRNFSMTMGTLSLIASMTLEGAGRDSSLTMFLAIYFTLTAIYFQLKDSKQ